MSENKANLLLVDDTPANLQLLLPMFSQEAYRLRVATNGARALELVEAEKPDLILLDIVMPNISGYDVCRQLKADPETVGIPIIFLSALNEVENKLAAFELGGVDYITKPFHAAEVLTRVNTHLTLCRLQQQLTQANTQLQRQVQELDAYAHTVAHDLKSPLSVLLGYVELLENAVPDTVQHIMDVVTGSAHKANEIVEELLLLATMRQQKKRPSHPLNMWAIVENAQVRLNAVMPGMEPDVSVKARLEKPETWPVCLGYAPWIEEVWINYLSNALKYGGDRTQITVGGDVQGEVGRFWVQDRGPGLTAEDQSKLFAPFERLKQARAQGHGLGLSIVRRIVETLNGEVGVESKVGEGSLFYFTLPRAAAGEAAGN